MGEKCSISEFTYYLQNPDLLSKQNVHGAWLFWYHKTENELNLAPVIGWMTQEEKDKIKYLVEAVTSIFLYGSRYMVQFWAVKEDCLTTVDQPFAVLGGQLYKGHYRYRKLCEAHQYSVKEGASLSEVGSVGRVYLNRNPESTPDLRLYSTTEFPLRSEAASCGLRSYLALPLFDLHMQHCYGVLEIVSGHIGFDSNIFNLGRALKRAGLRSTHIGLSPKLLVNNRPESEILQMMKSAMELVPQLHFVQIWRPCEQCFNESNNLNYMQRIDFFEDNGKTCVMNLNMYEYVYASEFHHLQIGKWIGRPLMSDDRKSSFCQNICDFSICENPLAHYAQRARLSFCFVVHLQNVHNSNNHYLVEFFLQPNCRQDACDASFLHLLLEIMEKELKSYKFDKSIVELRKTSALTTYEYVEWKHQHLEEVNLLTVTKMHRETYLLSDFKKYFEKADLSCLQQPCVEDNHGWIFGRQEILINNTAVPNIPTQETTRKLMTEIATKMWFNSYGLVQFWAVGMNEDRLCLETSEQPFTVGSLDKGLAFFRKQCMECYYFVDELISPLQRVFQSGHPETSPDLRLYSNTEFPLRDLALHCNFTEYLGFPVFDQHKKCIGVLEYFGAQNYGFDACHIIGEALEAASLSSTHHNKLLTGPPRHVDGSRKLAEAEIVSTLNLFKNVPQLYLAEVWVTHAECDGTSSNISCMEQFQSSYIFGCRGLPYNFRRIQTGKGIVGMVLASENKSCFCRSSCNFSIADEPLGLAHHSQQNRLDVCFAVCLQSSHTGDLLYVLEFFLYQGPATYEYVSSFLHILFPIMVQELTSFRLASGQQLGDDLVVDVIEFPHGNHMTSSDLNESCSSPFKFKTVVYGQQELPHCDPDVMDTVSRVEQAKPSNPRERGMGKRKVKNTGSLNLTLEDLRPHFGKPLAEVAEEVGAAKSTIKRAHRRFGIDRWPSSEKYIKNPSLFEAAGTSHDNSSSNIPPPDMSLPPTNAKTPPQPLINLMPESETVTVKAKYEDKIIKFKLCLSSTMNILVEEVGRRLDLEKGSFELRYLDEDNDNILLACDDDLQLCFKGLTAMGRTTMVVSVHLILKSEPRTSSTSGSKRMRHCSNSKEIVSVLDSFHKLPLFTQFVAMDKLAIEPAQSWFINATRSEQLQWLMHITPQQSKAEFGDWAKKNGM